VSVPGKHDAEIRVEVQGETYVQWVHAAEQAKSWKAKADRLRDQLEYQLGDATGGTVFGTLVVTHRPKESFAIQALIRDNPGLTQHYMRTRTVEEFDLESFLLVHAEVAEKYRVREFRLVVQKEEGEEE
jgi:hypothetical protein